MKRNVWQAALLALLLSVPLGGSAAEQLSLQGIGKMTVPPHMTFQKGAQEALPFMADGGVTRYFIRKGASDSQYYTMTYGTAPDFTYGWAMSQKLGIPYLLHIGAINEKDESPEVLMDLIAAYLNKKFTEAGAIYDGPSPLVKNKDKKNPRWEGSFTISFKERDITYHEAYQVILQCDGYFTTLGVINTDADHKESTEAVKKMVQKRKLPEKVSLLDLAKRGTSLTGDWK